MLERNDELIEQFNQEEQKYRRLQFRKKARRKLFPRAGKKIRKALDRLAEIESRPPAECVAKKWIG
ncbi:MAG: hypothetical protein WC133_00395 [Candidatus Omnitrophota bacterium]